MKMNEVGVTAKKGFQKHALGYTFLTVVCMVLLRVLSMDSLNIKRLCG
jgi:hypothetical protein